MTVEKEVHLSGIMETPPRTKEFRRIVKVFLSRKIVVFGLLVIIVMLITAIFAPAIAPYDPYDQNLYDVLQQPSSKYLLGTDAVGRDTLSRIVYGTRTSLMVGVVALSIAATIGLAFGLIAGYFGGLIYAFIMRCTDALMCFPMILLALVVAAVLGSGLKNVMLAVGIALIPAYCRLMCGQVLAVKENDYVLAGRAIGASNLRIMFSHVMPNCFPPLIVLMTMQVGMAILAEAGLSFLGIGIEQPTAAWGSMVSDGYQYLLTHPILSFAPGLTIMIVVFAFNMVGDGLRDALDPKLRGTL
jgi:ABC-type dipeptide/oligopeptide/nickel transport system permease subunit